MVQQLRGKGVQVQRVTLVTFTTQDNSASVLQPGAPGPVVGPKLGPAMAPASKSAPGPAVLPQRAAGPGQGPGLAPASLSQGQVAAPSSKLLPVLLGDYAVLSTISSIRIA